MIVDEVLAVGDAQFQQKCLGKMEDVSKNDGRTVLFVSHNMGAITALCQKGVLLSRGKVERSGPIDEVVANYLKSQQLSAGLSLLSRTDRSGTGTSRFSEIYFCDSEGHRVEQLLSGQTCELRFRYEGTGRFSKPQIKFTIYNRTGQPVTHFDSNLQSPFPPLPGSGEFACRFPKLPLSAGYFNINVVLVNDGVVIDYVISAFTFTVLPGNFFGTGRNVGGVEDVCLYEQDWHFID